MCQRWAPSSCHFPQHSRWGGEPIHLSKCWALLGCHSENLCTGTDNEKEVVIRNRQEVTKTQDRVTKVTSCWCSDTTKRFKSANDLRGNVGFSPSMFTTCITPFLPRLYLTSGEGEDPQRCDWGNPAACSDFYRQKEKHRPPTSTLLRGLTLLEKQAI